MGLKTSTRVLGLAMIAMLAACAHSPTPPSESTTPGPDHTQMNLTKLQERVQDLETRISALNDKVNLQNGVQPSAKLESKLEPKPETPIEPQIPTEKVVAPAAYGKVIPKPKPTKDLLREEGFKSDAAIDRYREAKILFDTEKFSDAVIEFSDFVKNEPDHPLSPAAQYFLGMSYYQQKEYKLAEEELSRVLLSYPHSNYIPDTLLALANVSEQLKKDSRVTYFRQKLLSLFPNSPHAKNISLKSGGVIASETASAETEEPKLLEKPRAPVQPEAPIHPTEENQE